MLAWRRALRSVVPDSVGGHGATGDVRRDRDEEDYELLLPSSGTSSPPPHHGHSSGNGHIPNDSSTPPPSYHRRTRSTAISRTPTKLLRYCVHFFTVRRIFIIVLLIPVLLAIGILWSGIPPSFSDVREYERRLPQHQGLLVDTSRRKNATRGFEGHEGAGYLRFPGHIWGHGLNNVLQEAVLSAYLAYAANRSYVFEDYVWSHTPFPYTIYDFALRPARVPLNAFLNGPMAGALMPPSGSTPHAPEAVSSEFYELVCPPAKRRVISARDSPNDGEGDALIEWWVKRLEGVLDHCVEVDMSEKVVFDKFLFGSSRILSLLPGLLSSPILANFQWSPLVLSAITRNWAVLRPENTAILFSGGRGRGSASALTSSSDKSTTLHSISEESSQTSHSESHSSSSSSTTTSEGGDYPTQFDSMLAVHIRRGDYKRHCPRLAQWGSPWMGISQHENFKDKFNPNAFESRRHALRFPFPDPDSRNNATSDVVASNEGEEGDGVGDDLGDVPKTKEEYYMAHCLPSVDQIVRRLIEVKKEYEGDATHAGRRLKKVYILTNGWSFWLSTLEDGLRDAGFDEVISSYNIEKNFDKEQKYVGMAVDMAIAERAELFVGNGFSSLSSNIILLRMARGMGMDTNRLL